MSSATAARQAYCPDQSGGEREQLILQHLPQVKWIAIRIHESIHESVALDDLISTGIVGLINAIDNYDPSFGAKLKTYAEYRIRGAILDSLRGQAGVPEHRRKRLKQMQAAMSSLESRLLRVPTEEEIASELGVGLEEYHEWLGSTQAVSVSSFDAVTDEEGLSFVSLIPDTQSASPSEQFERAELEKLLATAIERMPQIEKTILSLHFTEDLNLREIARILGLHHTRISQLKTQAILRLRTSMQRNWPAGRGL